ncbi:MAG: 2-C-methyl-D-erythritol 2,4-cyclodiphosphate synthase [Parvicella sp.]|jgi:2-C-methyl-D-erythritol 2,4-cyclodiphosphate synthase
MRIGQGYDVHRLVVGRDLIIGGVNIRHSMGLEGHSDADVLLHAICDALYGAAALGDIGSHFSPHDSKFEDMDSQVFLRSAVSSIGEVGYRIVNIDSTIIAEAPKMQPYILAMRECIAACAGIDLVQVSVKATTTEGLGFAGEGLGIAAQAVVLLLENTNE